VEKVVYLLLGPAGSLPEGMERSLHGALPGLRSCGAKRVQLNVVDEDLGPPFGVAPDSEADQILAMLSAWVDAAEGNRISSALPDPGANAAWHGWLVSEAEPLANRSHPPGSDGRVPGFAQVVALIRPEHMSWSEWRRAWQRDHTTVAIHTQSTFRYVQNLVVRPLTRGAPPYSAVVEECFPTEAASDLTVFFDAQGDDARLARHMSAMSESCDRFMDGMAPVSWTKEWVYE
jgi:hypothetical protein